MNTRHTATVVILTFAAAGLLATAAGCNADRPPAGSAKVRIGQVEWEVELALTPDQRELGLGGRESIPKGTGMLLVFPTPDTYGVWMKDCLVPMEVAFISANLTVVEVRRMIVEPDPADPKITYESEGPVSYILEVAEGALTRAGVKSGDKVILEGAARDAIKAAR